MVRKLFRRLKNARKQGAAMIIFTMMLTIMWPIQTGIELDSTNIPLAKKELKQALIAATKSAAQQLNEDELHKGNYVIDPDKALQAFNLIMEENLKVDSTTWKPKSGSKLPSSLHVKTYIYNDWKEDTLPGQHSSLLGTAEGDTDIPLREVEIPVKKPTILAIASETYTSFWGKKITIEEFASAQINYASNGTVFSPQSKIDSIVSSGTPNDSAITIQGVGFGVFGYLFDGNTGKLQLNDMTRRWTQDCDGCAVTEDIINMSDTEIVGRLNKAMGGMVPS